MDTPIVEGYVICDRGHPPRWVRDEVARITGGRCAECAAARLRQRIATIELVGQGRRLQVPERAEPRGRRRKKKLTAARLARKELAAKARHQARMRLSELLPDLYDALLAEERATLGLEPWPVQIAVRASSAEPDLALLEAVKQIKADGQ